MIGSIEGSLSSTEPGSLIVDVGGIGYEVVPSKSVLVSLPDVGKSLKLFVYTYVREDQLTLFGFESGAEKQMFKWLLSVSGIGPKSALAVLSVGSADEVAEAVAKADVEFFSAVPGIGKKSAQRIIVDLKGKLGDEKELDLSEVDKSRYRELIGALKSMGFAAGEFKDVISQVDSSLPLQEQIKQVLRGRS